MSSSLKIIEWPDPRLTVRSEPATPGDASLRDLATQMLSLMREAKGVGLAAPQVGLNVRLFVANHDGEPDHDRVYVNPRIEPLDGGTDEDEEGCLSLPGIRVPVLRDRRVRLRAYDLDGKPLDVVGEEFEARVWQHENDHLDGILLLDRMGPLAKMAARKKIAEMRERYDAALPPKPKGGKSPAGRGRLR